MSPAVAAEDPNIAPVWLLSTVQLAVAPDAGHFGSLKAALLSLFQVITLDNWSDIYRAARVGAPVATPIYFISATNFNLLGADEWIKGFKFITYIDCFDGLHPNLMSPKTEEPHEEFQSIEDINNYLLTHSEVRDFIESRKMNGKNGKALFLMFDEKTEALAKKAGLEVIFPPAKLRSWLDNKVNTNRVAEKAGVPCVPYLLHPVKNFEHLMQVAAKGKLGNDLVVQTPYGDSGHLSLIHI